MDSKLFVNPEGRIIRVSVGKPFEEFSAGRWVALTKPISPADPWDTDSRPLTPEELAMVEKSGVST